VRRVSRTRNTLGKNAKGCRQCTLLDLGVEPTDDLVGIERAEVQAYWRRRMVARRVPTPVVQAARRGAI
jgi:hypothetical protein